MIEDPKRWEVIHGDCLQTTLPDDVAAVISDPPYGMKWNTDSTRFSGGQHRRGDGRSDWLQVHDDDRPFDPSPWVGFPAVILWGANHYVQRLLTGTTLVWIKKHDHLFGTFLSDAEIGWQKGGYGVYCFRDVSNYSTARLGLRVHPTQKPVELMRWCIKRLNLAPGSLILDPYAGSGTTGVAAVMEGMRFLGIEREERYVEIARRRIADAAAQTNLFGGAA